MVMAGVATLLMMVVVEEVEEIGTLDESRHHERLSLILETNTEPRRAHSNANNTGLLQHLVPPEVDSNPDIDPIWR